jgi:hypothetical protein
MFLGPAWFCIKLGSMVLYALFIMQKKLANVRLNYRFFWRLRSEDSKSDPSRNRTCYRPECFVFYLNSFHSWKIKILWFSAALSGRERAPDSARLQGRGVCLASHPKLYSLPYSVYLRPGCPGKNWVIQTPKKRKEKSMVRLLLLFHYCITSVNPVPNAQVCYFNNVWFMF